MAVLFIASLWCLDCGGAGKGESWSLFAFAEGEGVPLGADVEHPTPSSKAAKATIPPPMNENVRNKSNLLMGWNIHDPWIRAWLETFHGEA